MQWRQFLHFNGFYNCTVSMDVITISSDSEEPPVNFNVCNSESPEEDFYVDWNNDDYPSINYDSSPAAAEQLNETDTENKIENFVTPNKLEKTIANINTSEDSPKNDADKFDFSHLNDVFSNEKVQLSDLENPNKDNDNLFEIKKKIEKSKTTRPKLSQIEKEQIKLLKEQTKLEKKKLKEVKKAEKLKQKTIKTALIENQRNLKPEENIKFLKVHIDNEIINSTCGGNIISTLQQNNINYVVETQTVSFTIMWTKRKIEKFINDFGELSDKVLNENEAPLLYLLDWEKAVKLVHNNELLSHVQTVYSSYIDKKLTLIIYGLGKYFDYKKFKKHKTLKAEIYDKKILKPKQNENPCDNAPNISKDQLEFALTDLQLLGKFNCRLLETPEELSSLILNFTKSLSLIEYKLDKQNRQKVNLNWFAPGDSSNCVKVDKNGNGLLRLWQQQICQFSSVSLETSQAIVSHFSSPMALINAYENCELPDEGELLLQDIQIRRDAGILSTSRRVGPQLSKKIYKFFTSDDPEVELG